MLPTPTWSNKEHDVSLYLGNSLDLVPQLGPISALVTDPPYGISFRSNYRQVRHKAIIGDETLSLLHWACALPVIHSRYVFSRWDALGPDLRPTSCITWVKNNWSMGDLKHAHASQTECILFWPGPQHCWPGKRPRDVAYANRTGNKLHPTEKPVDLMTTIVGWTRGPVLDPFMGSGSTGIACVDLGRPFIGIELDEAYFDTTVKRITTAIERKDSPCLKV